jgi:hypothetical protein
MSDVDKRSAAMRGSHRGTPIAWAVMVRWEYRDICDTYEQAKERADAITYWDGDELVTASVQPLHRFPYATLSADEREAVQAAIDEWAMERSHQISATLRGLLERLG